MKAFVSLHSSLPKTQSDNEVCYLGYRRMEIEFTEGFGDKPVDVLFPEVMETIPGKEITHICIGATEEGDAEAVLTIHSMPYIKIEKGAKPRIVITNIAPDGLPANLNPIARVAFILIAHGQIKAEELHPALYEAINAALGKVGLPPIPVTRAGTAKMVQTMGWGLNDILPPSNSIN